jgi:hypothetical protein
MRSALLLSLGLLAACAAPTPPAPTPVAVARAPTVMPPPPPPARGPGPVVLRNPDFALEMPPHARCARGWNCTMHANPDSFRFFAVNDDGRPALCVEPTQKKEPWAIVSQGLRDPSLRGTRLRFSISMRLTDFKGRGAGPWAQMQRALRGAKPTIENLTAESGDWTTRSVEFDVPQDAVTAEVGMTFRGTGRACLRDARLEVLPARNPV